MMTIFYDFCQYWRFSEEKEQCCDQILAKTSSSLSKKTPIFLLNFSAKKLKKS
jgi:hypothetical protein